VWRLSDAEVAKASASEEVYLKAYDAVGEALTSIGRYLDFYKPPTALEP